MIASYIRSHIVSFICPILICSREILEDLPDVDCVLVSVGGGGLISGIGAYLKHKNPRIQVNI